MNDHFLLEKLQRTTLTRGQQLRLFTLIGRVFERAIDVRSPQKRPPGKAGLKSEKGYYRLLYLEDEFHQKVDRRGNAHADLPPFNWAYMSEILRQLKDLPELRSELIAGVDSALDEIVVKL